MNKSTSNLIAFSVGVLAGSTLGLLFAPEEGKNTRNKLTYKLAHYSNELREMINKLVAEQSGDESSAKSQGQKVINDTKEQAEKLLSDVEGLIGQIKSGKN